MIITILLSCFTILASAVPTPSSVLPSVLSQGGATQATSQKPEAQTLAPLYPEVEPPQSGVQQQQEAGPPLPPLQQHYTWSPQGGGPMIIPVHRSQPANLPALPQQPLMISPYAYFPVFSSLYGNQLLAQFPTYGFQMMLVSPPQQSAANQPHQLSPANQPLQQSPASQPPQQSPASQPLQQSPASQPLQQSPANQPETVVSPGQTPSGVAVPGNAPTGNVPQSFQQQQSPQIVYMLQQTMNAALGSLSSEELEMAAKMGRLGVYLPTVLTNPSAGAVQPVNRAAGLTNTEQQGLAPTVGTSSGGAPQTLGPASAGLQPSANRVPAGLARPSHESATNQAPAGTKLQPTQGHLA